MNFFFFAYFIYYCCCCCCLFFYVMCKNPKCVWDVHFTNTLSHNDMKRMRERERKEEEEENGAIHLSAQFYCGMHVHIAHIAPPVATEH